MLEIETHSIETRKDIAIVKIVHNVIYPSGALDCPSHTLNFVFREMKSRMDLTEAIKMEKERERMTPAYSKTSDRFVLRRGATKLYLEHRERLEYREQRFTRKLELQNKRRERGCWQIRQFP